MAILSGKRLGPYEILSAIGAGGMGELYRTRDTRLERIVAVKILPDHLSDRSELRQRLEREARTIASLNHPHICTLHDIGQQDGTDFLVIGMFAIGLGGHAGYDISPEFLSDELARDPQTPERLKREARSASARDAKGCT